MASDLRRLLWYFWGSMSKIAVPKMLGSRFGRLVVIGHMPKTGKHNYWECLCDCGNKNIVPTYVLRRGSCKSCGCIRRELSGKIRKTHGMKGTTEYGIWRGMLTRCLNQNDKAYPRYGGRGITVCDRWLTFENFFADMGYRPAGKTLDRVDNNGSYCLENCRWATWKEQANNKRNNVQIELRGITRTLAQWCDVLGIKRNRVYARLSRAETPKAALLAAKESYDTA